ncbi:Transcriptional regulator [Bifidobacterium margollesii]|uniref:Transcriptional regulator n=1 Tax=Bifidobacterium margollesii TaxID=2020964 RepID=A0A2N5J8U6_9BIFI|nr:TetR/AcrR family transcriptional regulator [Bifidobacterium margollesii]PLS30630.1 Transcriptional regulator [Bifidobacterium margollesii]
MSNRNTQHNATSNSTETKRDLRVQKTYTALMHSFQELLARKRFDDITVTELCDEAMVRTATFYKHFRDKFDFFVFMVDELRTERGEIAQEAALPESSPEDYYLNIVRNALGLLNEHRTLFHALDSDAMASVMVETSGAHIREQLVRRLHVDASKGLRLAASPELTAELLIGAINQVIRWWLSSPAPEPVERLEEELTPFVLRLIGREDGIQGRQGKPDKQDGLEPRRSANATDRTNSPTVR